MTEINNMDRDFQNYTHYINCKTLFQRECKMTTVKKEIHLRTKTRGMNL